MMCRFVGSLSVIVTTMDCPVSRRVTFTLAPIGSHGCAAVIACWSNRAPDAVRRPWCRCPYQDAVPVSEIHTWFASSTDATGAAVVGAGSVPFAAAPDAVAHAISPANMAETRRVERRSSKRE